MGSANDPVLSGTVTKMMMGAVSLTPGVIDTLDTGVDTAVVAGLTTDMNVIVLAQVVVADEMQVVVGARVSAADTLEVTWANPSGASETGTAASYAYIAWN